MMRYRKLGRTAVDVGVVGLGAEHLEHAPKDTVISVVNEALDQGVNYIDLFLASPSVRDNFGIALKNKRHDVIIAGHLGAALKDGQSYRTRDRVICEKFFRDLLIRLQTDYIDVLMLHNIDEPDDYELVFGPGGILELALRLKKEGEARFLGMSTHRVPAALNAVNSGYIDLLMFPVNPAFDTLPGDMKIEYFGQDDAYDQSRLDRDKTVLERKEVYHASAAKGVGIVAMKPYAAGLLFTKKNPSSIVLTPVQCLSYALSQPAVCAAVPGCRSVEEMKAALGFLEATEEEKDYSSINLNSMWRLQGSCMYCNHCLPCPVGIDIGVTTRITDIAGYAIDDNIVSEYKALSVKASECVECGVCTERCPFGVDVIANMARAVGLFRE